MKLIDKIQLSCALPAAFLVAVSLWSIWGFSQINNKVITIYDDRLVPLKQLKSISDDYAVKIIDSLNKTNAGKMNNSATVSAIESAQKSIEKTWEEYNKTALTPKEQKLAEDVKQLFTKANPEIAKVVESLKTGDLESIKRYDGELYDVIDPLSAKIQELIDLQLDVAQTEREGAQGIFMLLTVGLGVLSIITLLIVLLPLRLFIKNLVIATLRDTVNTLASTASQIATASEEHERLTEKQADSVHKTTTTMDELRMSAVQSAQQAESASLGAEQVLHLSENGNLIVNQTLTGMSELQNKVTDIAEAMGKLSEQLSQIDGYQKLVAEIADQTYMLALNAAVEAVNAGEQGKGFMVVATEIRKLSEKSKQSAERINNLIVNVQKALQNTVKATVEGTRTVEEEVNLAQKTASTFESVANAIEEVVINVQQISLNAKQQASAVEHVVDEMNSLNRAAIQTASGVSQTKEGTQKLTQKATELKAMV